MFDPARMKARRTYLHLTCAQLASRIGAHESTVWRWEAGDATPSATHLTRLAAALRVPFSALLRQARTTEEYAALCGAEAARRGQPDADVFDTWADTRPALLADRVHARLAEAGR